MPNVTLTNLTASPVLVQELYITIPAGGAFSFFRSFADLSRMTAMQQLITDGDISYAEVYTDFEVGADFDPVQGEIGGGSSLPALPGVEFSVLMESPIGTVAWGVITEDMIFPPFVVNLTKSGGTTFEVGQSVVDPSFTLAYTGGTPIAASINDGGAPVVLSTPFTSGQIIATYNSAAGSAGNNNSQGFSCTADSAQVTGKTDSVTVVWRPRVYYGVSAAGTYNEAFIEALATSALASSRTRTINYSGAGAGDFLFYAFPTSYGTPTFTVGGFAGGFELAGSAVSVTNAYGNIQNYDLWKSVNDALGTVSVAVT